MLRQRVYQGVLWPTPASAFTSHDFFASRFIDAMGKVVGLFSREPLAELGGDADVAISSPWVSRLLSDLSERAVAHQSYLRRSGLPRSLAELSEHRLLSWDTADRLPTRWPLTRGGFHPVEPSLVTNDLRCMGECIGAGLGIGLVPMPLGPDITHVLPGVLGRRRRFWLVSARPAAGVRVFEPLVVRWQRSLLPSFAVPTEYLTQRTLPRRRHFRFSWCSLPSFSVTRRGRSSR